MKGRHVGNNLILVRNCLLLRIDTIKNKVGFSYAGMYTRIGEQLYRVNSRRKTPMLDAPAPESCLNNVEPPLYVVIFEKNMQEKMKQAESKSTNGENNAAIPKTIGIQNMGIDLK